MIKLSAGKMITDKGNSASKSIKSSNKIIPEVLI